MKDKVQLIPLHLFNIQIVEDKEKNKIIYENKKQEILENTIEAKREKIFFIEID